MPRLQHQQAPEMVVPRSSASPMFLEQPLDGTRLEVASRTQTAIEQQISTHVSQLVSKPSLERNAESFLGPVDDLIRQEAANGLLEDVLAVGTAQLQVGRETRRKRHELVIEHRRSPFEGVRHRRDVDFYEQTVAQVVRDIDVEHRIDEVLRVGSLERVR